MIKKLIEVRKWHLVKCKTLVNKKKKEMHRRYANQIMDTIKVLKDHNLDKHNQE